MTERVPLTTSLKQTGSNLLWYAIVCVLLAIGYMAYDTHGFTKPFSWFSLAVKSAGPALAYMPSQPKETTE